MTINDRFLLAMGNGTVEGAFSDCDKAALILRPEGARRTEEEEMESGSVSGRLFLSCAADIKAPTILLRM